MPCTDATRTPLPPFTRPAHPFSPPRRLFTFTRLNNKALGGADLSMMASSVVLSALSILPYEQAGRPDADPTAATERAVKMATILGFSAVRGVACGCGCVWLGGCGAAGWGGVAPGQQ